ncbi:MAG: class I SAM-dependent methyltransferase [Oscillatoria sp. PMC 1068.18]|nr:class I SAM-dependent methyltransferase [Oscillatoria sp. PMC 1076.18]MEC4988643.1 class I SAM-dependent methyltransferase [Oscillatoria sp. PMC 1068.18]
MKQEFSKFDISITFKSDNFAPAPTIHQRDWTLHRAIREFGNDLLHIDAQVRNFIDGKERPSINQNWENSEATYNDAELIIQGQQVMQAWEHTLMKALAEAAGENHGDVLEIGFGMGISATYLQEVGIKSYTVIECNDQVISRFEHWKQNYPDQDIRLVKGMWQEVIPQLHTYDGILFDTYPLSQEEYIRNEVEGLSYSHCGEFFPTAASLLRKGGVFTYFSCEIDTLSRGHQRMLLEHFDAFEVSVVRDLQPPAGCQYWWSDSMVVVKAYKR